MNTNEHHDQGQIMVRAANFADLATLAKHTIDHAREVENLQLDLTTVEQGIALILTTPGAALVACTPEGEIVGSCWMAGWEWSDRQAHWFWWITSVFVAESHRHRGIMKALYQHLIGLARDAGTIALRAYAHEQNLASLRAHQNLGFKVTEYGFLELKLA